MWQQHHMSLYIWLWNFDYKCHSILICTWITFLGYAYHTIFSFCYFEDVFSTTGSWRGPFKGKSSHWLPVIIVPQSACVQIIQMNYLPCYSGAIAYLLPSKPSHEYDFTLIELYGNAHLTFLGNNTKVKVYRVVGDDSAHLHVAPFHTFKITEVWIIIKDLCWNILYGYKVMQTCHG